MTKLRLTALALSACLVVGLTGTAGAEDPDDPEAALEEARRQRAALATDLDVLHASEAELHAAAEALAAEVEAQEAALEASERAVEVAEAEVRRAEGELSRTRAEIDRLTAQLVDRAVSSFVAPARLSLHDVAVSANFTDAARKQAFIARVIADEVALVDDLDGARERLEDEQAAAEAATEEADRRRSENVDRLASLEAAAAEQTTVQEAIDARAAEVTAEIEALAAAEAELSALIEQRAREQREAEERARIEAEAARAREEKAAAEARAREQQTCRRGNGLRRNGLGSHRRRRRRLRLRLRRGLRPPPRCGRPRPRARRPAAGAAPGRCGAS
jgi:septal ring factor EnvC (AmiA/AmiB activator)